MENYKDAIMMALNTTGDRPLAFNYHEDQDVFKIFTLDYGWYDITLEGKLIRSCHKWLKEHESRHWMCECPVCESLERGEEEK